MQWANSATFRLKVFLLVSYCEEKLNLKNKLQQDQKIYIRFLLNLPTRSRIDPSHFTKIK